MPAANDLSYIGHINHRRAKVAFGIKQRDRLRHMYLVGATGSGKSSLMEILFRQDVRAGRGCILIDPHGDLAERARAYAERVVPSRVIYLDAADLSQPFGYNPLRRVRYDRIPLAVSGFLETLRKQWPDAWGVRMEHLLRNSLYALFEQPEATLPDILRLYVDDAYRTTIAGRLQNSVVRHFWQQEYVKLPERLRAEAAAPIQNKLGAILTDPRLYRILVAPKKDIRFRQTMDTGGVLIINLAKGRLGEDSANILGGLVVSTIGLAALSRAETPEAGRRPLFLYVDEFQTFTTQAFVSMLSDLRKYGLGMVLSHQHTEQLETEMLQSILGNAGTIASFRLGSASAAIVGRELGLGLKADRLQNLASRDMLVRLLIDGEPSLPFTARCLDTEEIH